MTAQGIHITLDADISAVKGWCDGMLSALAEVPGDAAELFLERVERLFSTGGNHLVCGEAVPAGGTCEGINRYIVAVSIDRRLKRALAAVRAGDWDNAVRHLDELLDGASEETIVGGAGLGVESGPVARDAE